MSTAAACGTYFKHSPDVQHKQQLRNLQCFTIRTVPTKGIYSGLQLHLELHVIAGFHRLPAMLACQRTTASQGKAIASRL
jgi:hypothetical protein